MPNLLSHNWTFWYDKTDLKICGKNWDQFLIKIYSFNTIENFFRLGNSILSLTNLPSGSNYHFFKTGIEPKWEDPENIEGGRWVFSASKNHRSKIEKIWEKTIFEIITNRFSIFGANAIKGLVGSARMNEIRISIWTADASDKNNQISIGKYWKNIIGEHLITNNVSLIFFSNVPSQLKTKKKFRH
ncbi:eukaryotic translation initiation factor 4E (nucleomorph) [Chroomonas mesostigmatica CCMP1168]|uniref:Eukaryotic translation initiation factor 4E n=1 Tax=Chroomonas mesostigmatica CCMP1168 TaxID=1195612 RepID=J7G7Q2_9CRYP|nr:eukaryotic translation initiation factor 4E [Chroomonas mesostigmatica CCMP1168]|mmetsp:Transcript_60046/g.147649  ORF Transcript_60046/g.147649 Transcript_60046/m.147649 type:complete len:186 (+) Transcript_60046:194-751(+)